MAACGSGATLAPPAVHLVDTARATANAVTVSPLPGTPDASPTTQISFLGAAGTTVLRVRASGSRSGRHRGALRAYSTGTGESFLPAKPFVAGEHVTVTARVRSQGETATVRTQFTIGFRAPVSQAEFPRTPGNPADVQHFASAPTLTPSTVRITVPARTGAASGDLFLAPYRGVGTAGPMIAEQSGGLVWFHPLPAGESATNFRPQRYAGRTVLTWWQGRILRAGFGQGVDEIYDASYRPLAQVRAGNGYHADLHEFRLEPDGTAWIDAFDPVEVDLSGLHGSDDAPVSDSIVQQIDVRTGLVMWEWHALGHIALAASYSPLPDDGRSWDYVHLNSIDPSKPGEVLLSSRNTSAIYVVSIHSGATLRRIGGRSPTVKPGAGTAFYYQHDAEWQPGGMISVFDNGGSPNREPQSRGLVLDPEVPGGGVALRAAFAHPGRHLLASSQGNLLNLGSGRWLMGYGGLADFTEYAASGAVLLDGSLGAGVQDYRTYLAPWSATPAAAPAIAAQRAAGGVVSVHASWNGATAVAAWRVLAGNSPASLHAVATVPRGGFETAASVPTRARLVAVQALDASGRPLRRSRALAPAA